VKNIKLKAKKFFDFPKNKMGRRSPPFIDVDLDR
jgi:hypothetical protein